MRDSSQFDNFESKLALKQHSQLALALAWACLITSTYAQPEPGFTESGSEKLRPASTAAARFRETERMLSPFEVDALLTSSGLFGGRERRVLTDFQDNTRAPFTCFGSTSGLEPL